MNAAEILERRAAEAQARAAESFTKARDIAREKYGIDWPNHGGFVVVKASEMVLEKKK